METKEDISPFLVCLFFLLVRFFFPQTTEVKLSISMANLTTSPFSTISQGVGDKTIQSSSNSSTFHAHFMNFSKSMKEVIQPSICWSCLLFGIKSKVLIVRFVAFSLNYIYLESICWKTAKRQHENISKKKKQTKQNSLTKHHLFACRPALTCEIMHWIWFEVQFFLLTSVFATGFRGNSNRRLQSAHNKAALLCSRPSNCHVTRKRESSWTSGGKQANAWEKLWQTHILHLHHVTSCAGHFFSLSRYLLPCWKS